MEGRAPKLLLQGPPGVGKTTVMLRLAAELHEAGIPTGGFVTREVREHGRRRGFVAEEIGGREALIAHVDWARGPAVGRYRVDVEAFERVALPAMHRAEQRGGVVLVDELGSMELASAAFVSALRGLVDAGPALVATVHSRRHPVTDALKARPDVDVLEVSRANRDELPGRVKALLTAAR
jgi:nucleoside-triphosphatase